MHWRCAILTLATALLLNGALFADKTVQKEEASFGAIKSPDAAEVRKQAETWLKSVGKSDAATLAKVQTLWASDRPLLDKVSGVLTLGDAEAGKLLAEARDADAPAPTAVPALLKDAKKPAFFRNNLALAYARALTTRKVYEDGLDTFEQAKPEESGDPSALCFHTAGSQDSLE